MGSNPTESTQVIENQQVMKRFFDKINKTNTCWNWTASLRNGYGVISVNGKNISAHRISWELHNNRDIPEGMVICHTCDNRKCVNPNHLFLGTQSDNMKDCSAKGRLVVSKGVRFEEGNSPKTQTYHWRML